MTFCFLPALYLAPIEGSALFRCYRQSKYPPYGLYANCAITSVRLLMALPSDATMCRWNLAPISSAAPP